MSLAFVGMVVDRHGVRAAESKIATVVELSLPTTVEEFRAFLRMAGYLKQVVEGYGLLAAPLIEQLHNKTFAYKRSRHSLIRSLGLYQHAVLPLKSTLTSFSILAFSIWNRPFVLPTDTSAKGAGATLTQTNEGAGRPLAFTSHRWLATDSQRGATERECMAVVWVGAHVRPHLASRPFTLVTDCSGLT